MTRVLEVVCREITASGDVVEARRRVFLRGWREGDVEKRGRIMEQAVLDVLKTVERELEFRGKGS